MAKFETLVDVYRNALATYPGNPLFGTKRRGQWEWLTYREFGRLTDGFRAGLAGLGVTRGDRVAIIANNRVECLGASCGGTGSWANNNVGGSGGGGGAYAKSVNET